MKKSNKQPNKNIQVLINKTQTDLQDRLSKVILEKKMGDRFIHPPKRHGSESPERFAKRLVDYASAHQFVQIISNGQSHYVSFGVPGPVVTRYGKFFMVPARVVGGRWGTHHFLFYHNLKQVLNKKEIFLRLDSGCLSGQVFGDITCDCREQLDIALKRCVENGCGVVINIPEHEGRGWGEYKMANQQIMDELGLDTVEAARLFYGDETAIDQRTYEEAVIILRAFGFKEEHQFCLGTNNPRKVGAFVSFGMSLSNTNPVVAKSPNPILEKNLLAKSKKWKHMMSIF